MATIGSERSFRGKYPFPKSIRPVSKWMLPSLCRIYKRTSLLRIGLLHIQSRLGKRNSRGARRLGRGKIKARGQRWEPRVPVFSLQRSHSRFFLWCLLTGASAEERANVRGYSPEYSSSFPSLYCFLHRRGRRRTRTELTPSRWQTPPWISRIALHICHRVLGQV